MDGDEARILPFDGAFTCVEDECGLVARLEDDAAEALPSRVGFVGVGRRTVFMVEGFAGVGRRLILVAAGDSAEGVAYGVDLAGEFSTLALLLLLRRDDAETVLCAAKLARVDG